MKQLGLFSGQGPGQGQALEREPEKKRSLEELDLELELDLENDRRLAARIPPRLSFGPSSWTFAGWQGIVYPPGMRASEITARGLEFISRHPLFRTVGIDRSYYAPMTEAELRRYASQLPESFPCVIKAWSAVTSLMDPKGGKNPHFLSTELTERAVLLPLARAFAPHVGAVVFQLAPMPSREKPGADAFAERLDRFLGALPTAFSYGVELRNKDLLTPAYLEVLRRHRVSHVLNLWERMPRIGEQLNIEGVLTAPIVLCRLNIAPGQRYEERKSKFAPFDKIVAPDEATRDDILRLVQEATASRTVFVTVNNKFEGSSPLSIRAMMEGIAATLTQ